MCSPRCLKVSLLVFLSISLVFCQLQIFCFMLLSYWLSLILAIILSSTLFTLAFYGALADSHVALYVYISMQITAWIVESILLMTIGLHIIGWDTNKFVLHGQHLIVFGTNSSRKILEMKHNVQNTYSGADVLENYLKYYSHVPIFCRDVANSEMKSHWIDIKNRYRMEYQKSSECQITLLAWFTVLRDVYDLVSLILATIYACFLHKTTRPVPSRIRRSRERLKSSLIIAVNRTANAEEDKPKV